MEIVITNLQKKILLNPPLIKRVIRKILLHESIKSASLSLVFVSAQKIRALNKKFLNEDCVTDVLAFDLRDNLLPIMSSQNRKPRRSPLSSLRTFVVKQSQRHEIAAAQSSLAMTALCGEIIISTDAALQYARVNNVSLKQELVLYVIHGILHLLGYDDHQKEAIRKMRMKEQEILARLGKSVEAVITLAGKQGSERKK